MFEKIKSVLASSRFLVQLAAAFYWIWSVPLKPLRRIVSSTSGAAYTRYRQLWTKVTHDKYGGFVYWRGGMMVIATLAGLWIIPTLINFTAQTALFFATHNYEEVYLIQSAEIYPDDNIWSVRGCDRLPCDGDSSIYFRIAPSLFTHVWSVLNTGWIFLPDNIGSGVPTGLTKCRVRSYGVRIKTLMNRFEIYPDVLEISCDAPQKAQ